MEDLNDKVTGDLLEAPEWNQVPSEIQNVIEGAGIALSAADLNQLGKAVAAYAAGGDFYTDSGIADAYVLSVVGAKQAPPAYFNGMRIRFVAGNTNTSASTVNVAGLGAQSLKDANGAALSAGYFVAGASYAFWYDGADFVDFDQLRADLSSTTVGDTKGGFNLVYYPPKSGEVGVLNYQYKLGDLKRYLPSGYVTDGSVDYASEIASAFASGYDVVFPLSGTFQSSTTQIMSANTSLFLNACKLKFTVTGATEDLVLRSGCVIFGGTVENAGSSPSGSGNYQSPIVIGDYGAGTGYERINILGTKIITNRPNGNGIFVTGDSNNIKIHNVDFPDSSTLGRGILVHWGGADAPASGTFHPYNISIENITGGIMTDASVDGGLVFLSSCYNVKVTNTFVDGYKWESGHTVVFAGDYGAYYAPTNVKDYILKGIVITNAGGVATDANSKLIKVEAIGTLAPVNDPLYAPILNNCNGKGIGTGHVGNGILFANCIGGEINHCNVSGFFQGFATAAGVVGLRINGGLYYDNELHGVAFNNGTAPPEDCVVNGVDSYANGKGGSSSAGIFIGVSRRCKAINTITGEAIEATQDWGVRVDNSAVDSIVTDNYCRDVTAVAFSIGSSTTYGVCKEYHGNTSDATTTHSGTQPQIITTMHRGSNVSRECLGSAAPTAGAWNRGDRVYHEVPVSGGSMGWVCVIAGTPGTWKGFGAISA